MFHNYLYLKIKNILLIIFFTHIISSYNLSIHIVNKLQSGFDYIIQFIFSTGGTKSTSIRHGKDISW